MNKRPFRQLPHGNRLRRNGTCQKLHAGLRINAIPHDSRRVQENDGPAVFADFCFQQSILAGVHDGEVLEDDYFILRKLHCFQVAHGCRIDRKPGGGNAVLQRGVAVDLLPAVQEIVAFRIDHEQDLSGGTGRKARIFFPHFRGTAYESTGSGTPVHSAPDVEKPEGETVDQRHSELAFQSRNVIRLRLPPFPDSAGKRDEFGHFQVGFARNAVALEHEADVSAAEHFRYTDISGITSDIRRTVARRADHEIGRSGIQHAFAVKLSADPDVADMRVENSDFRTRPDMLPRRRDKRNDQIRRQFIEKAEPCRKLRLLRGIVNGFMQTFFRSVDQRNRILRQIPFPAPRTERDVLADRRFEVAAFNPFEGPSARNDAAFNPVTPFPFAVIQKRGQIRFRQRLPLRMKNAIGQTVERIQRQTPCKPERRIQVHSHQEPRGGMMRQHLFNLTVQNAEIVNLVPFPDQRIIGIGIADRIHRIHRRNADQVDSRLTHKLQSFPFPAQKFSVRQTVRQHRSFHHNRSFSVCFFHIIRYF